MNALNKSFNIRETNRSAAMKAPKHIFNSLFQPPKKMQEADKKDFLVALMGVYLALVLHSSWLVIFCMEDIVPLSVFNVFSVGVFTLNVVLLLRWGRTKAVMMISGIEVIAHQCMAVYYLGWDLGFQYYLLAVVSYIFMAPFRRFILPIVVSLTCLASFVVLHLAVPEKPFYELGSGLHELFFITNVFFIFALIGVFAYVYSSTARQAERLLQLEYRKSNSLLLNILPEEVADELKTKGAAEAKQIAQVTVLFTDFKGFTAMSEQVTPKQLVSDLHECFSAFDAICEKHGIEKIKTIGDAFMAAGGLPLPNNTHATDVIYAAFEMCEFIAEGKASRIKANLPFFEIRIGVHTGPVVAGIVGVKKFQYDIWGDTVNTASRMESSGEVGMVNISEATYELVKGEFRCTFRGEIEAKGKGKVKMYFVSAGNSE